MVKKKTIIRWILMFVLFILITPDGIQYMYGDIDKLFHYLVIIIWCFLVVLNIIHKKVPTTISVLLQVLNIWLIITTYMYKNDALTTAILNGIKVSALCLVLDYYSINIQKAIKAYRNYYYIVIFINFITVMISFPNGLYSRLDGTPGYFLGYRNALILFFLPALFFALLDYFLKSKILGLVVIYLMCLIPTLMLNSSTTTLSLIIGLLIFGVIQLKIKTKKKISLRRKKTIYIIFGIYLFMNVVLISINYITKFDFIIFLIENILGRSITFTGRTNIWTTAAGLIANNLIYGYGIGSNVTFAGATWYGHNQIIEIMLEGGIVAIAIFAMIIFLLLYKIYSTKYSTIYNTLIIIIPVVFIFFLTEASTLQHFVPIYIIGCNFDRYIESSKANRVGKE